MNCDMIQIVTTTETREQAGQIASMLVERRLVACVQIVGPIESTYRWKGKVERSEEWRVEAKTRGDRFDSVARAIQEIHPYEEPELIALPIVDASEGYRRWVYEQTDTQ